MSLSWTPEKQDLLPWVQNLSRPVEAIAGFLQTSAGKGIVETKHFKSACIIMESLFLHWFLGNQCLGTGNRSLWPAPCLTSPPPPHSSLTNTISRKMSQNCQPWLFLYSLLESEWRPMVWWLLWPLQLKLSPDRRMTIKINHHYFYVP